MPDRLQCRSTSCIAITSAAPTSPAIREAGVGSLVAHLDTMIDNLAGKGIERELIAQVMLSCHNVQTKAAAKLGINRNTLHKKLKEYGLES